MGVDVNECRQRFVSFYDNVKNVVSDIQGCTCDDNNVFQVLNKLKKLVGDVVSFIDAPDTINALKNNISDTDSLYPLSYLSNNILQYLIDIEPFLKKETLDFQWHELGNSKVPSRFMTGSIHSLIKKLEEKEFVDLMSVYDILKHLDGHNKTLIVLGPNGSGKTSFANYIKTLAENIRVIPASKPISSLGYTPNLYGSTLSMFNKELYCGESEDTTLLKKLIIGLCKEHDDVARKFYDDGVKKNESTYNKIKDIFDSFFEVKLDNSGFSEKELKAKKRDGEPFDFNNMSDGERTAFFYIATVVAAPPLSFIVVDEPENHLNPAVYNKIWDKLIAARKDCQFIFISHTIEFIQARTNFELVKINRFVYPNKFDFVFLGDSLEGIPMEYIVEIMGSRKPILFCEGTKSDLDYKIYEKLFGKKYTVIATGTSSSVLNSVITCNRHSSIYNIQSAIGIIDSDLKSEVEIERLKGKNIYPLLCNEIEMLLLDEFIFKKVLDRLFEEHQVFDKFKAAFFAKLNERKTYIVKRLVKTQLDERIKSFSVDDKNCNTKEDIKNGIDNIFKDIDIDRMWSDCEEKIEYIVSNNDYEEALKYCCLEHGEILRGVTRKIINTEYTKVALGVLEDEDLSSKIKSKYFCEIPN